MVSIQSAEHVAWLAMQGTSAGVDLTKGEGVPLAYDYTSSGSQVSYSDLTNSSRDVTPIFAALNADGWPGDYHTNQRSDCSSSTPPGQPFAGFGWRSLPKPGIEDWGVCHTFNKILCEEKGATHR